MVIDATNAVPGDYIVGVAFATFYPDYRILYKYMGMVGEDPYSTVWFEEEWCPVHVPS